MKIKDEYRPNVAAIILSAEYPSQKLFLLAKRKGVKRGWQFPQGGIDKGETPVEALYRELEEEIGTRDIEIIAEYPEWIKYDFPKTSGNKIYPFKGQNQKYFLVQLKPEAIIDLSLHATPEFEEYIYVTESELFKKARYLKRRTYKTVIEYFKKKGFI